MGAADTGTMKTQTREVADTRSGAVSYTSDEFLSMVLDRTTDGVVMTDGAGVIVYANAPLVGIIRVRVQQADGDGLDPVAPAGLHGRRQIVELDRHELSRLVEDVYEDE